MAGVRYRVYDLPNNGKGAFLPFPAIQPMASSYGLVRISAMLGTNPVPVNQPFNGHCFSDDASKVRPSMVAPNLILPDKYVAYADNMGPVADANVGMATRRLAPLPVPAKSWRLATRSVFRRSVVGGRTAMNWPRAYQRWGS